MQNARLTPNANKNIEKENNSRNGNGKDDVERMEQKNAHWKMQDRRYKMKPENMQLSTCPSAERFGRSYGCLLSNVYHRRSRQRDIFRRMPSVPGPPKVPLSFPAALPLLLWLVPPAAFRRRSSSSSGISLAADGRADPPGSLTSLRGGGRSPDHDGLRASAAASHERCRFLCERTA